MGLTAVIVSKQIYNFLYIALTRQLQACLMKSDSMQAIKAEQIGIRTLMV